MSRSIRSINGLLADQFLQILSLCLLFIVTPILIQHAGALDYGFWLTVITILGFIGLVDPGVGLQITRTVALSNEDCEMRRFLSTTFYVQLIICLVFFVAGVLVLLFFAEKFGLLLRDSSMYRGTFIFALLTGVLAILFSYFTAILSGRQRLIESSLLSQAHPLIGLMLGCVLVFMGYPILTLALSNFVAILIAIFFGYYYVGKYEKNLSFSLTEFDWREIPKIIKFSLYFQSSKLAFLALMSAPTIVVASLLGPSAVASFVISSKLAQTGGALIARAANIVYPGVSELYGSGDVVGLKRLLINLQFNSARIGLWFAFVVYLINEQFIHLWVGEEFFLGMNFTIVVCAMVVRDSIVRTTGIVLFASSNIKTLGLLSLVEVPLTIFFTYYLTDKYGIIGAAIGPLIATALIISPYSIVAASRICSISLLELLHKGLGRVLLRSIPAGFFLWLLSIWLPKSFGWYWIFIVMVSAVLINMVAFDLMILLKSKRSTLGDSLKALLQAR